MFEDLTPNPGFKKQDAEDLLQELEQNTPEELVRQRAHFRITIKAPVTLQPGNASERLTMRVRGVTGDISQSGCKCLFPTPVGVGDVYRLEFDKERIGLPTVFAQCMRCSVVRDDAYEAGFKFFTNVTLPDKLAAQTAGAAGA